MRTHAVKMNRKVAVVAQNAEPVREPFLDDPAIDRIATPRFQFLSMLVATAVHMVQRQESNLLLAAAGAFRRITAVVPHHIELTGGSAFASFPVDYVFIGFVVFVAFGAVLGSIALVPVALSLFLALWVFEWHGRDNSISSNPMPRTRNASQTP